MLDIIGKLVTIIGFPIAIYAIWTSNKNAQRAVDIQIVATLSLRFQDKWEREWRSLASREDIYTSDTRSEELNTLYDALNWIDWIGVLIEEKAFAEPALIIKSIKPSLRKILFLGNSILNEEGKGEWPGVFQVAKWVDMLDKGPMRIKSVLK